MLEPQTLGWDVRLFSVHCLGKAVISKLYEQEGRKISQSSPAASAHTQVGQSSTSGIHIPKYHCHWSGLVQTLASIASSSRSISNSSSKLSHTTPLVLLQRYSALSDFDSCRPCAGGITPLRTKQERHFIFARIK